MKRLCCIIFVSLLLVSCKQSPVPHVPAKGTIVFNDVEYSLIMGEYEWKENNVERTRVDEVSINALAEEFDTINVTKDSTLNIDIEDSPTKITVIQWYEGSIEEEVKMTNNQIHLPSTAGYYIYEIIAEWNQGRITYIFDVNVS